jgi:hypothetical protein
LVVTCRVEREFYVGICERSAHGSFLKSVKLIHSNPEQPL